VSGLCLFDAATSEHGTRHTGIEHGVTTRLEPGAQQRDVRRAAYTVRALDDDELAAVINLLDAR
jgi:hypothetical protein